MPPPQTATAVRKLRTTTAHAAVSQVKFTNLSLQTVGIQFEFATRSLHTIRAQFVSATPSLHTESVQLEIAATEGYQL